MSTRTRVLLAVHSLPLADTLTGLIVGDGELELVATVHDRRRTMHEVIQRNPDVVVLDLRLADGSGLLVAKRIRTEHPRTRLVILTDDGGEEYQRAAWEAGASACVAKVTAFPSLLDTIKGLSPA